MESTTSYPSWITEKAFLIQTKVTTLEDGSVKAEDENNPSLFTIKPTLSEALQDLNQKALDATMKGTL